MWYNLIYIELKFKIEGKQKSYNNFFKNFRFFILGRIFMGQKKQRTNRNKKIYGRVNQRKTIR